ncbi:MAG: dinitrogenase iron-molybdenum cofactor [Euryarchaeota archaeon]|nr:dinitrogenase iron-molybdenum cofactor [Euryarchaeota archaeon]
MKIAVPSTGPEGLDSEVSMHFGRTPYYTFITVENGVIKNVESVPTPFEEHGPGDIPNFIKENNGDIVIAYGMGQRAVQFFNQLGIKVILGAYGRVGDVVNAFLKGNIKTEENWKEKGDFGHQH